MNSDHRINERISQTEQAGHQHVNSGCGHSLVVVVRPINDAQLAVCDALMEGVRVLHRDSGVSAAVDGQQSAALDCAAVRLHVQGHPVVHVLQPGNGSQPRQSG